MCLTTSALLMFLSLLPPERVEIATERIVINADARPAIWVARGEDWCTNARQIDQAIRLGQGRAA